MSGYNLVGASPRSMYEGEGFRSYFRKGKGTSMIAEMLPFVFQVGYSMKNPGSWKGMYSKAYSMFTKKGGASVVDPKWAAKFRGVDKAWGVTVMDNYIMGLDYGLGDVEASIFAHSLSTATGFSQMILPDSRWLGGTVFTNAKDTFVNGLKKTATLKGVAKKQGYKNAFIGLMSNVFFEEVEELVEMGSQDVIKHAFGLGHTAEFRDWKTQQSTLAGVILLGGTSAPIQITNDYREGRNAIYKEFKKDTQKNITNIKNIVFSGWCALNVLGKSEILKHHRDINLFIDPVPTDSGQSIGGAYYYYYKNASKPRQTKLNNIFLGPEYDIEKEINYESNR